jgi:coxsackievirus/adenovirus receptor
MCYCRHCKSVVDRICGTDGQTYINRCQMKRKACQSNTKVKVAYKGKCEIGKPNV